MAAVFAHGSLRLYLLRLLSESPHSGYDLIQALSDRFGGTYSPSAGTIYPRLAKLEEEGLVTKETSGRRTIYSITEAGRLELTNREHELTAIEDELTDSVRRLAAEVRAGVNDAMRSLRAELASAARDARESGGRESADAAAPDRRSESLAAAREAEIVLNDFRQQVRTDLRTQAARAHLTPDVVAQLRSQLAQVRADILSAITPRT